MSLEGKKIIILVENMYEELELWYPYYRLIEEGADVKLVGPSHDNVNDYKGKNGYPAQSDLNVANVDKSKIDAILIPGGFAPDYLRRYNEVNNLVKDVFKLGKIIGAICHGPSVLINADILKGKKATSFMAIKQDIINAGATYIDEPVVQDGNLITSRKPADLPAYCKAIINALK
ncbi:MAG: type 1 glutamine amidotransferase domain-containing protein [Candidatus Helarchaeota archaeon]